MGVAASCTRLKDLNFMFYRGEGHSKFSCRVGHQELIEKHAVGGGGCWGWAGDRVNSKKANTGKSAQRSSGDGTPVLGWAANSIWEPMTPFYEIKQFNEIISMLCLSPTIY